MKQKNLKKVLSALVDDCGYETVKQALDELRPLPKPQTAAALVDSLKISDDEKEQALKVLAQKYDTKQFMPGVKHIRDFLDRMGRDASRVKSRQKVPVAVFQCLATWDTVRLVELNTEGRYAPKGLKVIAEAIEGAKRTRRA